MRRRLLAAAALCLAAPAAHGQTESPRTVPLELVQHLFGTFSGTGEPPEILVGRLPDVIAADLPLPQGARAVGAAAFPGYSMSLLAFPGDAASAHASVIAALRGHGWTLREEMAERGGFTVHPPERMAVLCRGSAALVVIAGTDREGGSRVHLMHGQGEMRPGCGAVGDERPHDRGYGLPVLLPPAEAFVHGISGPSGSGYDLTTAVKMTADLAPASLAAHYGAQLREKGWTLLEESGGDLMALQAWRGTDERGNDWWGLLAATAIPGTRERVVHLLLSTVTPED